MYFTRKFGTVDLRNLSEKKMEKDFFSRLLVVISFSGCWAHWQVQYCNIATAAMRDAARAATVGLQGTSAR